MENKISKEDALDLLHKYNKEDFHIKHALTVAGTMRYFAESLGYSDEADYWELVGLLHDVDFEMWPDEHCIKARELLKEINCSNEFINSVSSHGYGICCDIKPEHEMEKVLFAADELTGLIGAYALMRPEKNADGMAIKSLKKKFKDKKFAAGCDRETITKGADMLGWEMDKLFEETIKAVQSCQKQVDEYAR